MLGRTSLRSADKTLPPGALITFLQKGLQYVGIEESLQQQHAANTNTTAMATSQNQNQNNASNTNSATSVDNNDTDFSILSPTAISAISRRNPPIQLNVPPATAAAAVKARLEVEAKLQAERNAAVVSSQLQANGLLTPGGMQGSQQHQLQQQQVMGDPNQSMARQAIAAQAAAAHMTALHHQMSGLPGPSNVHAFAVQQQQQQQRAEMMALTQQQQQQQQQMQGSQMQQHNQHPQLPSLGMTMDQPLSSTDAATTLASVATQVQGGVKRPTL
jgi:hypothetical protein